VEAKVDWGYESKRSKGEKEKSRKWRQEERGEKEGGK